MDNNAQVSEECRIANCGSEVFVMVGITGLVGDRVIEVQSAVFASKVT